MNPLIKNIIGVLIILILAGIALPFCTTCTACLYLMDSEVRKSDVEEQAADFAQRACACRSSQCSLEVKQDWYAFAKEHKDDQGTPAQAAQVERQYDLMMRCINDQ